MNLFRHYKGGIYELLMLARDHQATEQWRAVYISFGATRVGEIWTRPYREGGEQDAWCDMVEWPDGVLRARFVPLNYLTEETTAKLVALGKFHWKPEAVT